MNILAFDTSYSLFTPIGFYFGAQEKLEMKLIHPENQEQKLLAAIDSGLGLLGKSIAEIDTIAVGIGPGSFTGIRIGVATARALAWSGKKRIAGISSLELLARSIPQPFADAQTLIIPVVDSRMKRIYSALFSPDARLTPDTDIEASQLCETLVKRPEKRLILMGDGLVRFGSAFDLMDGKEVVRLPEHSVSGLSICEFVLSRPELISDDIRSVEPEYLRKSEAEYAWEKKQSS